MSATSYITVLFDCHECGLLRAKAFVRERWKEEQLLSWIKEVNIAVGEAHSLLSPLCQSRKVDLRLPVKDQELGLGYHKKATT